MKNRILIFITLLQILSTVGMAIDSKEVKIPAGSYMMGTEEIIFDEMFTEKCQPKHKVQLDAFFMDKYEVSQKEFKKLLENNPSASKRRLALTERLNNSEQINHSVAPVGNEFPVTDVSWFDAAKYCNVRSKEKGLDPCYNEDTWECDFSKNGYRLPTEAEWEYACRAGENKRYYFGDDKKKLIDYANYWPEKTIWFKQKYKGGILDKSFVWNKPFPNLMRIGQKKPNKWGLYDMLGNAQEWCNDWYDRNFYKTSPVKNPFGPKKGKDKVLRGGCYYSADAPCASRTGNDPKNKSPKTGFRCVRNVPKSELNESKQGISKSGSFERDTLSSSKEISAKSTSMKYIYLAIAVLCIGAVCITVLIKRKKSS